MTEGQSTFRTNDLALAAYLLTRGWVHDCMAKQGDGAVWVYDRQNIDGDEAAMEGSPFDEDVREYFNGEALVEPREFMRKVGLIRQGLYRFLGISPRN